MSAKFKNTYRIESARLPYWDYGWEADYFITICTQGRTLFFGEIENGIMVENELGKIANKIWQMIPEQFPYAQIDEYIIMPNHVHGIISIVPTPVETQLIASPQNEETTIQTQKFASPQNEETTIQTQKFASPQNDDEYVKTQLIASLQENEKPDDTNHKKGGFAGGKNPLLNENISRIVRWYKGRCSFEIRKLHADFGWQSRFHDHIIRNSQSYENIRNYIITNPQKWKEDTFWEK